MPRKLRWPLIGWKRPRMVISGASGATPSAARAGRPSTAGLKRSTSTPRWRTSTRSGGMNGGSPRKPALLQPESAKR